MSEKVKISKNKPGNADVVNYKHKIACNQKDNRQVKAEKTEAFFWNREEINAYVKAGYCTNVEVKKLQQKGEPSELNPLK